MTGALPPPLPLAAGWRLWPELRLRSTALPLAILDALPDPDGAAWVEAWDHAAALVRDHLLAGPGAGALAWQNPDLLRFLRQRAHRWTGAEAARKRRRVRIRRGLAYLLRYAARNETVGFFGPVAWGRVDADVRGLNWTPGPLVAQSRVVLEPWVAAAAVANGPLRLHPAVRWEAGRLSLEPGRRAARRGRRPGPDEAAVLEAAARGAATGALAEGLRQRGVLVPAATPPLLADPLSALGPAPRLALALDALGRAPTDADAVLVGQDALADAVVARTGGAATRRSGQDYAARTPAFLVARRGGQLVLGPDVLAPYAGALALLGAVSRWYTWRIATLQGEAWAARHATLGGGAVPLPLFLRGDDVRPVLQAVGRELRRRWAAALGPGGADDRSLSSTALAPRVATSFAAPCPGWPSARLHSPDLLLGRAADGSLQAVLGELHPGHLTLYSNQALLAHPDPSAAADAFAGLVGPVVSEVPWPDYALCAHDAQLDGRAWFLDAGSPVSAGPPSRRLRVGDIDVLADGMATHRPSGLRLPLVALLERRLKIPAATSFSLHTPGPRAGRISVDGLVLSRRRWRVGVDHIAPVARASGPGRAAALRALARAQGWPERGFLRVSGELKPIYVDLRSTASADLAASLLARSQTAAFTELLPDPASAWLTDEAGGRYASELRIALIDPVPWSRHAR